MHRYVNLSDRHTVTVGSCLPIAPGASGLLVYSAAIQDLIDRGILERDDSSAIPSTAAQLKRWLDDRGVAYTQGAKLGDLREAYVNAAQGGPDGGNR